MWASDALDNICRWMELLVLALLVLELKDSAWWVALVATMRWTPMLVFGMFSGYLADRANRWGVMVVTRGANVLITAGLLALVITDSIQAWHLLLGALALGVTFVFDMPSRHSFIYDLVGARHVVRAMSLEVLGVTTGLILGPLAGGLFVELVGFSSAYMFLLAAYILALLTISLVRSRITRSSPTAQPIWKSLGTAIRFSLENKVVLGVLTITLVFNIGSFSALQFYPVVARDHLHVGPGLTGVLGSAVGIGLLIGAIIMTIVGTVRYHGRVFVAGSAINLLALLLFAISPWYPLSFLILLMAGLGLTGFGTMQSTILLLSAEPERRGMAIGMMSLCIGIAPLGALQMGVIATVLNAQWAIGISAGAGLLLLIPIILFTPLVWKPTAEVSHGVPDAGDPVGLAIIPTVPDTVKGEST